LASAEKFIAHRAGFETRRVGARYTVGFDMAQAGL
jgi:hypothetical protein